MQKIEIVEIHRNDLLFRIMALQLNGNHPLYWLLYQSLKRWVSCFRIELLGQLLRNGRTATGTCLAHEATLYNSATQCNEIDARMLVEALVFGGYQSMNKVGSKTLIINHYPVLTVEIPCSHHLSVARINLRSIAADRVLQILNRRHIANPSIPHGNEAKEHHQHNSDEHFPQKTYECFSHIHEFEGKNTIFLWNIVI